MVRGPILDRGIFSTSKKDFSIIIETAVSLMVSHIMAWDPCASSPNITMKACARVVVEADCHVSPQLAASEVSGRPNGRQPVTSF